MRIFIFSKHMKLILTYYENILSVSGLELIDGVFGEEERSGNLNFIEYENPPTKNN